MGIKSQEDVDRALAGFDAWPMLYHTFRNGPAFVANPVMQPDRPLPEEEGELPDLPPGEGRGEGVARPEATPDIAAMPAATLETVVRPEPPHPGPLPEGEGAVLPLPPGEGRGEGVARPEATPAVAAMPAATLESVVPPEPPHPYLIPEGKGEPPPLPPGEGLGEGAPAAEAPAAAPAASPRSDMFRRLSERFGPPVALTTRQPGEPPPRRLRPAPAPAQPAASSLPGLHDLFREP